jgi:spore germination protein YaaH
VVLPVLTCISQSLPQNNAIEMSKIDNSINPFFIEEEEIEEEEVDLPAEGETLPISSFREVWGYVMSGQEDALKASQPISDVGYFGAGLNVYGQLIDVPKIKSIRARNFTGRVHLVVATENQALTHFSLIEGSEVRRKLIADLLEAAKPFDGLQIDFEGVPARDGEAFRSFLRELRNGLGKDKMFTVALRARTRTIENDVYDYAKIKEIVDRILVMAYDEHWSGSKPGSVASLDWCRMVANYAVKTIGQEKLIMGLPFYGRSWGSWSANRAYIYSTVQRIKAEQGVTDVQREKGIPMFTYKSSVTATVYYEDDYSLSARMEMYRILGAQAIGFWRVGQESPTIWRYIKLESGNQ